MTKYKCNKIMWENVIEGKSIKKYKEIGPFHQE